MKMQNTVARPIRSYYFFFRSLASQTKLKTLVSDNYLTFSVKLGLLLQDLSVLIYKGYSTPL